MPPILFEKILAKFHTPCFLIRFVRSKRRKRCPHWVQFDFQPYLCRRKQKNRYAYYADLFAGQRHPIELHKRGCCGSGTGCGIRRYGLRKIAAVDQKPHHPDRKRSVFNDYQYGGLQCFLALILAAQKQLCA